jgi:hypothetical protein
LLLVHEHQTLPEDGGGRELVGQVKGRTTLLYPRPHGGHLPPESLVENASLLLLLVLLALALSQGHDLRVASLPNHAVLLLHVGISDVCLTAKLAILDEEVEIRHFVVLQKLKKTTAVRSKKASTGGGK